jgi:hypothetical protein
MDVRGYDTGPIDAKGAFTSEIDVPPQVTPGLLTTVVEADRPACVERPGMRHKYLPLWHDPATGAISAGGRYLFRTYEEATAFRDFLEAKVFPGESTTFWNRPWFLKTVRYAWRVAGAHDLAPITTHDLTRFERYAAPDAAVEARLPELFAGLRDRAGRLGLAHVSLMYQPEQRLIGVVTAASHEGRRPDGEAVLRHATEALPLRGSVGDAALERLGVRKVFDRTSVSLTIWLPLSEQAGGVPAIWPNSPPIPLPGVEQLPPVESKVA